MADIYDVPSNSMKHREEQEREQAEPEREEGHGITPRKKGIGSFLRQLVGTGDMDSVTNIFANAMINAIGDTIDEVTGNLTHRAKTMLYGTEDYARGSSGRNRQDRYNSYSKYYDERRDRGNSRTSGSNNSSGSSQNSESGSGRWRYNDVFFDNRIFGGERGAELAAWRVIKAMDEQISNPDIENVSVGDFFRYCLAEDEENPKLKPEYTDEYWGWDDEAVISRLRPIRVPNGYIIELPKPKKLT